MDKKLKKNYLMKSVPQYLPLERAAKVEGVSPRTIYRRIQEGKTPYIKVEGKTYIGLPEKKMQKPRLEDFKKNRGEEISLREAARRTGIPGPTISKWIKVGKLDSREEGQYLYIPLDQMMYAEALYNYVKSVRGSTLGIDVFAV
jgi:predicted DNA-binding transcriptional regulator AlpA